MRITQHTETQLEARRASSNKSQTPLPTPLPPAPRRSLGSALPFTPGPGTNNIAALSCPFAARTINANHPLPPVRQCQTPLSYTTSPSRTPSPPHAHAGTYNRLVPRSPSAAPKRQSGTRHRAVRPTARRCSPLPIPLLIDPQLIQPLFRCIGGERTPMTVLACGSTSSHSLAALDDIADENCPLDTDTARVTAAPPPGRCGCGCGCGADIEGPRSTPILLSASEVSGHLLQLPEPAPRVGGLTDVALKPCRPCAIPPGRRTR